jgi:hydroxymethylglutaryl-CoA lyase
VVFAAASEAFSQKNINCSIEESIAQIASKIQSVYAGLPIEGRVDKVRGY